MRSWSETVTQREKDLGRDVTPEEFEEIRDGTYDQALMESLASVGDGEDDVDLRRIVGQVVREHPDWSKDQIKDSVRRQFLDVMTV